MSRGQPVVATPAAVEGIFPRPGEDVLVSNEPEQFAEAVVRLYQDELLWNRISAGGLENVHRYFSVETARANLKDLFRTLKPVG
jgi:glycosyltransferase involved in cell wall biosynthesis